MNGTDLEGTRGFLAGPFSFEAKLNEKFQESSEEFMHGQFSLGVGSNVGERVDGCQGHVPGEGGCESVRTVTVKLGTQWLPCYINQTTDNQRTY